VCGQSSEEVKVNSLGAPDARGEEKEEVEQTEEGEEGVVGEGGVSLHTVSAGARGGAPASVPELVGRVAEVTDTNVFADSNIRCLCS
jgi:hypothetical protein